MTSRRERPWLLAIDTATSRIVVAAGSPDGRLIRGLEQPAGHRHGERLLSLVEQLLGESGLRRGDLSGIIVGTGPGAFTGLRVGLATAKALAHAMALPVAGVGTDTALLRAVKAAAPPEPGGLSAAAMDRAGLGAAAPTERAGLGAAAMDRAAGLVLLLPAGPHDRVEVRDGTGARLLPGGTDPTLGPSDRLVAVDLPGRAPEDAVARGEAALAGLAGALLELGSARLRAGASDDAARLIPEYVTLPRGVRAAGGEIEWSHGPR